MGGRVITKDFTIDDSNRNMFFQTLISLYKKERKYIDERRRAGIKDSAAQGNYRGRSRIKIDTMKLQEFFSEYEDGELTGEQAAKELGISKSTFLRRYRERKKKNL